MSVLIVIPAAGIDPIAGEIVVASGGKSVLQHTYESACRSKRAAGVIVAVDDPRLVQEVTDFGGQALLTSPLHQSGTDRIAEVAALHPEANILVNVQGDEPEIDPSAIDLVVRLLEEDSEASIATVATPLRSPQNLVDAACVKVVVGAGNRAMYFSRAAVPMVRDGVTPDLLHAEPPHFWHHVGLYAYRSDFLSWFAAQPVGRLEALEKLEQLRALEAGHKIVVERIEQAARGIDTLEDFRAFRDRIEGKSGR